MSVTTTSRVDTGDDIKALDTIRRGIAVSPELRDGLWGTLALAVLATVGQVVIPIVVQQTLDRGLNGPNGPDVRSCSRWDWWPRSRSWSPASRRTS